MTHDQFAAPDRARLATCSAVVSLQTFTDVNYAF